MTRETERQLWLDIYNKTISNPARSRNVAERTVSREAWLAEFWRAHDRAINLVNTPQKYTESTVVQTPEGASVNTAEAPDWVIAEESESSSGSIQVHQSKSQAEQRSQRSGSSE
jgi:hypothetical protein